MPKKVRSWPTQDKDGIFECGKTFTEVWNECSKETDKYIKKRFPQIFKTTRQERKEIKAIWDQFSKEEKERIKNTRGNYIG